MWPVLNDPGLENLISELYAKSASESAGFERFFADARLRQSPLTDDEYKAFRSDKLMAMDRDKSEFCYQLCRINGARRVVEVGTSHGVSTIWLAAAVRDNGGGMVFGTEYEPAKVAAARATIDLFGLTEFVTILEGDARETLKQVDGPIDFVLFDAWTGVARPAVEVLAPKLRRGGVIVCDDSTRYKGQYASYFAFLNNRSNGFRTMTLPFKGGLEVSVLCDEPRRLAEAIRDIPMPSRIARLPLNEKGYPLPFFAAEINGRPDIRIVSTEKFHRCVNERICWLCGEPLDAAFVFVVPLNQRISQEPPCHDECAEYAMAVCPFIINPSMKYRTRQKRPNSYVMYTTSTYEVERPLKPTWPSSPILMGPPEKIEAVEVTS